MSAQETLEDWLFQEPRVWGLESGAQGLSTHTKMSILKAAFENAWSPDQIVIDAEFHASNPELSSRDCSLCQKYWWDHDNGVVCVRGDGSPMLREDYSPAACGTDAGCLKGTPTDQVGIQGKSGKTLKHFVEWRAVGCPVPHCKVMRSNWSLLSDRL